MLLKVSQADYLDDYKIKLIFNDGFKTQVDLKDKVFNDHREIFKSLREVDFFKSFRLDRWTIYWPNNLDIAPEFLYELAKKQEDKTTANKV